MLAYHLLCGRLHRSQIERVFPAAYIAAEKGRANWSLKNQIPVALRHCAMSRMKSRRGVLRSHNANGRGENAIQGALQIVWRDWSSQLKACNLALGVYSCIGAARSLRQDSFAHDVRNCFCQRALDGRLAGLDLPAVKICPIVGERQLPGCFMSIHVHRLLTEIGSIGPEQRANRKSSVRKPAIYSVSSAAQYCFQS